MSTLEMRRVGSDSRYVLQLLRRLFQGRLLRHLFRIAVSLFLLPLDNSIFVAALALEYASLFFPAFRSIHHRQEILRDLRFHPKTILITGVDTPHGLHIARCFYHEGHRVVGADITTTNFPSGGGLSKALVAYYRVPKAQYVPRLLDIVSREKVDIWIPCSQATSVIEDGMAKQAIEDRTGCKCITLDTDLAIQWSQLDSFIQYLSEKDLPVVENHHIQSRDSIHRILHRSPTKAFHIRSGTPAIHKGDIILPKRTLSLTYAEVSRMQVSKDTPWLMQQHARLGDFIAELLVMQGHVIAITVHPASRESEWGRSPLNEGLTAAIRRLMDRFASKCGARLIGHFTLRLMVDEELTLNSVRYDVHIAGCTQGAAVTSHLLWDTPPESLVSGYLAILSEDIVPETSLNVFARQTMTSTAVTLPRPPSVYQAIRKVNVRCVLPALFPVAQQVDWAFGEATKLLLFWEDWRFSAIDPLPWWWHTHVHSPLRELDLMLHSDNN
ncbi:hypothetical protein BDV12DRAFT_158833 [Aspergillus spectabilis]